MMPHFKVKAKIANKLGRAGVIETAHGAIETPAFAAVGTQASVKALSPEQVKEAGVDVVLANTYHLYLKPGGEVIREAGGIHNFMHWHGPIITDSGGFQVFSLGAAFERQSGKIVKSDHEAAVSMEKETEFANPELQEVNSLVKIDEDGVDFKSVVDGSTHRFTPEKSIEIQHMIGADIIFAFDECPSPTASSEYQEQALLRTYNWGKRSLEYHHRYSQASQLLFGIVQGGRIEELRRKSAKMSAAMDFDGFGIGGSFNKDDIGTAVRWVNEELPEERPRHLLGIGDPSDLIEAIENGCDLFDCVAPTRMGRNGTLYTHSGRINIMNAAFRKDFLPIEKDCQCYSCRHYSRSYISHLFRAKEMFAATLASIHNLHYLSSLVKGARQAILDNAFERFKSAYRLK